MNHRSVNSKFSRSAPFLLSSGKGVVFLFIGAFFGTFIAFSSLLDLRYGLAMWAGIFIALLGVLSRRFKRFFQALLVLSIPLLVRKTLTFVAVEHTGGPVGLDVLLSDYLLFILYVVWIYEGFFLRKEGEGIRVPRIGWVLLAFIAAAVLSISSAQNIRYSIFEIIRLLKVFFFFLYVVNHFNTEKEVRFVMTILFLIVIVHSSITFLQRFTGQTFYVPFIMPPPVRVSDIQMGDVFLRRPGGIIGNANSAAAFLAILVPTFYGTLFWKGRRLFKILAYLAFSLGLAALVETYSRAGWITIPPAVITLLFLSFRKRLLSMRRHLVYIHLAVFLAMVFCAIYSRPIHRRLTESPGVSATSRTYMMKVSALMVLRHPFFGHGVNNFNLSFEPVASEIYDPHSSLLKGIYHVVHNVFFLIAVDTGLVGLSLFLLILFETVRNAWAGMKARDPFVVSLSIGLLTSVQSFCLVETFDFSFIQFEAILYTFWLLIGLSVFVKNAVREENRGTPAVVPK